MPQYTINHSPYLQLGNAPLDGFICSETDQVEILWQTTPDSNNTTDSFVREKPETLSQSACPALSW